MMEENGIDDHDHYGDPDLPRSDDLYKRCKHGVIANECATCEFDSEDEDQPLRIHNNDAETDAAQAARD